jgi:hypothetical protein
VATRVLRTYDEPMNPSEEPRQKSPASPVDFFLAQPAYHADEDSVEQVVSPTPDVDVAGTLWSRLRRRLTHFLFEKEPSAYSSIAPRTPDGKRPKIFFFNGSGRGR